MGKISEQYTAVIITETEKDSNSQLEGTFDGTKYSLKIYDSGLNQIVFSYNFEKGDFLNGTPYSDTFFIQGLGNGIFVFGCSNSQYSGMIKAFRFNGINDFKQGKYVMIEKFIPQTVNPVCVYDQKQYIVGFDIKTNYITTNSFEIDKDLNVNVGNKSIRIMKYYNTIDGVAKNSGDSGEIISVYIPRNNEEV